MLADALRRVYKSLKDDDNCSLNVRMMLLFFVAFAVYVICILVTAVIILDNKIRYNVIIPSVLFCDLASYSC